MIARVLRGIAAVAALAMLPALSACTPPFGFPSLGRYGAHVTCTLPSGSEEGYSTDGYHLDSSQGAYTFYVNFSASDGRIWGQLFLWLPDVNPGTYTLADKAPATDYAMQALVWGTNYYAGSGGAIEGSSATVTVSGKSGDGVIWGTFEANLKDSTSLPYLVSDGRFSASPR